MSVQLIITRVQDALEDAGSAWTNADYICSALSIVNDDIEQELENLGLNFDTQVIILPSVPANTVDLSAYQAEGQPLSGMIMPKVVEWRLAGQNQEMWTEVDPVDKVIDTDTGTGVNAAPVETQTTSAVTIAGSPFLVDLQAASNISVGMEVTVDSGPLTETVEVLAVSSAPASFTAVFNNLHAIGAAVVGSAPGVASDDPTIESWEWRAGVLILSPSSQILDLRIRFQSLPTNLNADSPYQPFRGLVNPLTYAVAEWIEGKRCGQSSENKMGYEKKKIRALGIFRATQVQGQQSKFTRLGGRRSAGYGQPLGPFSSPIVS